MKRVLGWMMAAVVLSAASMVFAADSEKGCCSVKQKKACCEKAMSKLKLTDEQTAKIAVLHKECAVIACQKACKQKMQEGLKSILTGDQYKEWQAACKESAAKGTCPVAGKTE
jgi:hypothetical protein